ncbi:hypothetical protein FRC06_002864 [Ceratobasidium sp. 370]|nr:hypothetical protein FRC06_002864 [Ceratobasidium sp. 370]
MEKVRLGLAPPIPKKVRVRKRRVAGSPQTENDAPVSPAPPLETFAPLESDGECPATGDADHHDLSREDVDSGDEFNPEYAESAYTSPFVDAFDMAYAANNIFDDFQSPSPAEDSHTSADSALARRRRLASEYMMAILDDPFGLPTIACVESSTESDEGSAGGESPKILPEQNTVHPTAQAVDIIAPQPVYTSRFTPMQNELGLVFPPLGSSPARPVPREGGWSAQTRMRMQDYRYDPYAREPSAWIVPQ